MNQEGYRDPTADTAVKRASNPPEHVLLFLRCVWALANVFGLTVIERLHIRDKNTWEEWE